MITLRAAAWYRAQEKGVRRTPEPFKPWICHNASREGRVLRVAIPARPMAQVASLFSNFKRITGFATSPNVFVLFILEVLNG